MNGEPARTRTGDQKIKSLLLYQLSYEPHQKPVPNITASPCQQNFGLILNNISCYKMEVENFIICEFPCIFFNKELQTRTARNELKGHARQATLKRSEVAIRRPHSALYHYRSTGRSHWWNNLRKGWTLLGGNGWIFAWHEFGEIRHSTNPKSGKTSCRAAKATSSVELSSHQCASAESCFDKKLT